MSNGWSGADPTQSSDSGSYELGVEFLVGSQPITITAVRVWAGSAGSGTVSNRMGRVWTTAGSLLGTASMANTLPSGWTTYSLASPLVRAAGSRLVVSYTTGGFYGELVHGLDSDVVSSDSAVTAEGFANATNGNGVFTTSTTTFPASGSGNHTFYGIDIVYTVGAGGDGPTITGMSVTAQGATATATINATDPNGLTGATYSFDWGDGHVTSGSSSTQTHTYATSGIYAVLGTVTDAFSASAEGARPIQIVVPAGDVVGLNFTALTGALADHANSLGLFDTVQGHEAWTPPGNGITCAIWLLGVKPAKGQSGLDTTSLWLTFNARLYTPITSTQPDLIDPALVNATYLLMGAYSNAFTLGGLVREVDLLGRSGPGLSAMSAYQDIASVKYRVVTVTVPLLVDDVFGQVP